MNLLQRTERLVNRIERKEKDYISGNCLFLINGGVGYATEEARGDNVSNTSREPSLVDIKPKVGTQTKVEEKDGGTIVDIENLMMVFHIISMILLT